MEWVMFALVVGSMIYSGLIVVEYTNHVIRVQPRIARMVEADRELATKLEQGGETNMEARVHLGDLRASVAELSSKIADLRNRVQAERLRKQQLDLEYFKQRLKGRLRATVA